MGTVRRPGTAGQGLKHTGSLPGQQLLISGPPPRIAQHPPHHRLPGSAVNFLQGSVGPLVGGRWLGAWRTQKEFDSNLERVNSPPRAARAQPEAGRWDPGC